MAATEAICDRRLAINGAWLQLVTGATALWGGRGWKAPRHELVMSNVRGGTDVLKTLAIVLLQSGTPASLEGN
jgi:hypothetical protein